jgi:propionyl-CoA synthetase
MEDVISRHPDVAECAVVGKEDELKGQIPLGFIVLKSSVQRDPETIIKELVQMVRDQIGAFACFNQAIVARGLPKTRSGKILRGVMRKIADGEAYSIPSTIDDPIILREIEEALKSVKFIGQS